MNADPEPRFSNSKAVAAALMLVGILMVAVVIFALVVVNRACSG